eukprot:1068510-Rhodomonas_salina.3
MRTGESGDKNIGYPVIKVQYQIRVFAQLSLPRTRSAGISTGLCSLMARVCFLSQPMAANQH